MTAPRRTQMTTRHRSGFVLTVAVAVTGLSAAQEAVPGTASAAARSGGSGSAMAMTLAAATASLTRAQQARRALNGMSLDQRVGQLFLVGVPATGASRGLLDLLARNDVGSVLLTGRSTKGVRGTRAVVDHVLPAITVAGVRPLVATDQEGGNVQVLRGPGFSDIPTALEQGRLPAATLQSRAARLWGPQLRQAGVNLDLAPVLDTVPASVGRANQPIGRYDREYAHTPSAVTTSSRAFLLGLREAGVATTGKHFPGLGRATGNTDVTANVTDPTTRHDAYLAPFRAAVRAGVPFMMMSSATYPAIDRRHIAAFSSTMINGVLRGDLKFPGVVMSDSMAGAKAVAAVAPAQRALRFFQAGGDLLLAGGAEPVPAMVDAVRQRAVADPAFGRRVSDSALRVLTAKAQMGLVSASALRRGGVVGDFDGDGAADRVVYNPAKGTWRVRGGATVRYGMPGDKPVPADYDGDGRTDIAVFRPSTGQWYVRGQFVTRWGQPGDVPVPADYDGDGRTDLAVFRPSTGQWYVRGQFVTRWGQPGDVPVPADYTGDGRADLMVYRPSTGRWWLLDGPDHVWGAPGDIPVPADYTGDGKADLMVYRPSTGRWWLLDGPDPRWGAPGDIPVPADYTGDGVTDVMVYRRANTSWYLLHGSRIAFGAPGEVPAVSP